MHPSEWFSKYCKAYHLTEKEIDALKCRRRKHHNQQPLRTKWCITCGQLRVPGEICNHKGPPDEEDE